MDNEKKETINEIVAAHDVEIKSIRSTLDNLVSSVDHGFDRIYQRLQDQAKFPVGTMLTGLSVFVAIIALLAAGYIGKPMLEIKTKQEWMLEKMWATQYTLGKREQMIDANAKGILSMDETLQREMRLLDIALQREMQLNDQILSEQINNLQRQIDINTDDRFTGREGRRLQKQIDEISEEQRRRTDKVY